jgi:hypothetical protein
MAKQSHYRPGQALKIPGDRCSRISRQSEHECGDVVNPKHRSLLPPRKYSWYSFLLESESTPGAIVGLEGLYPWKLPVTQSEIEPANYRLEAHCLNQL